MSFRDFLVQALRGTPSSAAAAAARPPLPHANPGPQRMLPNLSPAAAEAIRKSNATSPQNASLGYSPVGGAAAVYDAAPDRVRIAASGPGVFGTPLFARANQPTAAPQATAPRAAPLPRMNAHPPMVTGLAPTYANAFQERGVAAPQGASLGYSPHGGAAAVYGNASDRVRIAASGPGLFGTPLFAGPADRRRPPVIASNPFGMYALDPSLQPQPERQPYENRWWE